MTTSYPGRRIVANPLRTEIFLKAGMKENIKISFSVDRINDGCFLSNQCSTPLELDVFFADEKIFSFDKTLDQQQYLKEFQNLREKECYTLSFVLRNKSLEHTKIDPEGVILGDCRIKISDLKFNDITLGHAFFECSEYLHNQNQADGEIVKNKFYGEMGCNGEVKLWLTTPIYRWLLEHL